jgi:single-strand DNA-binding protein
MAADLSFEGDPMNHLNSVLIEGNLVDNPKPETKFPCGFALTSFSYPRDKDGNLVHVTTFVHVVVESKKLAENCLSVLKKGRGVRVVGKLIELENGPDSTGGLGVLAEHVEFKPELKKN